jgi:hypothetical protein
VIILGICVLIVVLGSLGAIFFYRRPRQEAGVEDFRRHIDALSPEARREVQDRVRDQNQTGDVDDDDPGDGPGATGDGQEG